MCHFSCLEFGANNISKKEIEGKKILEVGSRNVNGSLREILMQYKPYSYLGIDIVQGRGVDRVLDVSKARHTFGEDAFGVVVMTEVLEHIKDWKMAIHNIKHVLESGGLLFLTTRSKGFFRHSFPDDYWRFEVEDMQAIFSDFEILINKKDPQAAGIFLKARKPLEFDETEKDLTDYEVYSIDEEVRPSQR